MCTRIVSRERWWKAVIRPARRFRALQHGSSWSDWSSGRCGIPGQKTRWCWRPVATPFRWRSACVRSGERSRSWTVIVPARWAKSTVPTIGWGCGEDRAHLFERALTDRVATRSQDLGTARGLQCISDGGEGVDPGQATVMLDVERTLCAFGEGLPPLSPQCAHAAACAAGVDAGAEEVATTVARQFGGSASASDTTAASHGPGDRGRGSAAAIDPTVRHQSGYTLRSGGGGGGCASLQSQQKVGRIPWP